MKAKHGNIIVDVWKITKEKPQEEWVQEAFKKGLILWSRDYPGKLEIPPFYVNAFSFNVPAFAEVGDYLILNQGNYNFETEKKLHKSYQLLDEKGAE